MHLPRPMPQEAASAVADDFEAVFRANAATVARWAAALGGTLVDVEDAVQEVFMVAHRRLAEFRGDAKVSTWLFQITRRVVLGQRRRARFRRWLRGSAEDAAGDVAAPDLSPVEELERRQAVRRLYAVLDRMNEKYRTVLVMTKLEGLPPARASAVRPRLVPHAPRRRGRRARRSAPVPRAVPGVAARRRSA